MNRLKQKIGYMKKKSITKKYGTTSKKKNTTFSTKGLKKKKTKYHPETMEKLRGLPCVVCGKTEGAHGDHIKTIASGGHPTDPANLMPVCLIHHNEKGNKGINHMAEKYTNYKNWLYQNGWQFDDYMKKWFNPINAEVIGAK